MYGSLVCCLPLYLNHIVIDHRTVCTWSIVIVNKALLGFSTLHIRFIYDGYSIIITKCASRLWFFFLEMIKNQKGVLHFGMIYHVLLWCGCISSWYTMFHQGTLHFKSRYKEKSNCYECCLDKLQWIVGKQWKWEHPNWWKSTLNIKRNITSCERHSLKSTYLDTDKLLVLLIKHIWKKNRFAVSKRGEKAL